MPKAKDLTGLKFGRLTVVERAENRKGHIYWRCMCECGQETTVESSGLVGGRVKSCGCFSRDCSTKHGMEGTPVYKVWHSMKTRCLNPNSHQFHNYGGRGITICDEWRDDFKAFYDYVSKLEHFGEEGYSLDRIDNNGNYEPENLRWADKKTQGRNRRTNCIVEYNGVQMCLKDAAEKSGISYVNLKNRIRNGDSGDKLFRPVKKKK